MKKAIFFGFFYYIIIAFLVMGWLLATNLCDSIFVNRHWFWLSHIAVFAVWCVIGTENGWFRGKD